MKIKPDYNSIKKDITGAPGGALRMAVEIDNSRIIIVSLSRKYFSDRLCSSELYENIVKSSWQTIENDIIDRIKTANIQDISL